MTFPTKLKQLCTPSYVYFVLSSIGIIFTAVQNMGNNNKYCLGLFTCPVSSCMLIFALKITIILFWTWMLNLMCKDGHSEIAWFLVLLPFVLYFMVIAMTSAYLQKLSKQEKKQVEPLIL